MRMPQARLFSRALSLKLGMQEFPDPIPNQIHLTGKKMVGALHPTHGRGRRQPAREQLHLVPRTKFVLRPDNIQRGLAIIDEEVEMD